METLGRVRPSVDSFIDARIIAMLIIRNASKQLASQSKMHNLIDERDQINLSHFIHKALVLRCAYQFMYQGKTKA
jgi:hypothetical protein